MRNATNSERGKLWVVNWGTVERYEAHFGTWVEMYVGGEAAVLQI